MIIDVVKTTFQSRKRHTPEGIERKEYQRGFSFAGIGDVCIMRQSPGEYRRFSRYLYWNDEEPDCLENEVLSERDDDRRRVLWDTLMSRVVDLSTFDDWRNDSITRFQVITKNGTPRLFLSVDIDRTRAYPSVSSFADHLPHLPLVRQSALVRRSPNPCLAKSPSHIISHNIKLMEYAGGLVILKTYDDRTTSPEILAEACNLDRLAASEFIINLIAGVVIDNYYYGPGPEMISGLLLEYAPRGSLESILCTNGVHNIHWQRRLKWAYQTTRAIVDMHALGIVHGDIKCSNIVVKDNDIVAIIDLGEGGGTEGWYWPGDEEEIVEDYTPEPHSDIYGLGVVLWQLTDSGKPVHGEVPVVKVSSYIPPDYCSVVAACCVGDGYLRPSAAEVLERISGLIEGLKQ
jgi:hypothetical protein